MTAPSLRRLPGNGARADGTTLIHADLLDWLRREAWFYEAGFAPKYHAVLSDPPYFLGSITERFGKADSAPAQYGKDGSFGRLSRGFMGKSWDGFDSPDHYRDWTAAWSSATLPSMYPGALGLFFGGTRTYDLLVSGLRAGGWEIIDCIGVPWCYGSGFPKSHNQDGHGTALKPAWEPCVLVRAPRGKHTFEQLYRQYGTGMLNIDDGRIQTGDALVRPFIERIDNQVYGKGLGAGVQDEPSGRWPANLILSDESARAMDAMSGESGGDLRGKGNGTRPGGFGNIGAENGDGEPNGQLYADSGGASRFFYTAKAASWEREAGLDGFELRQPGFHGNGSEPTRLGNQRERDAGVTSPQMNPRRNTHPTVKPIDLTRYLATLLLPPAHVGQRRLLVPFAGVGSEMIGARLAGWESITGVEREAEYIPQGQARLDWWSQWDSYEQAQSAYCGEQGRMMLETYGQRPLFAALPPPEGTRDE